MEDIRTMVVALRLPQSLLYFKRLGTWICFCCLLPAVGNAQTSNTKNVDPTAAQLNNSAPRAVFRLNQFGYVSDLSKRIIFVMPVPTGGRRKIGGGQKTAKAMAGTYAKEGSSTLQQDSIFVYHLPRVESGDNKDKSAFSGNMKAVIASPFTDSPVELNDWFKDRVFYVLDLKEITKPGNYKIKLILDHVEYTSPTFKVISRSEFVRTGVMGLLHYFRRQRANTPTEWAADAHLKLKGSTSRVDLRGGWCDASGDVSKYFSHLAYTNFMSPQQIPLVTWSLIQATEKLKKELKAWGMLDSIRSESLWGADYLMRSLSDSNYFFMTVFSYFKKDPSYREIVGLEANSVTTSDYACALREGAGMAIAALARISTWKINGAFRASDYLEGAKRAYQHILSYNANYDDDDGVANVIDDYCGLMAATELWQATELPFYQKEARRWAANLCARYQPGGYLRADGEVAAGKIIHPKGAIPRPFWHASDAGLPIVSLIRYLDLEKEETYRNKTKKILRSLLRSQLVWNQAVANPFDYPRQKFLFKGKLQSGFFIPHENESGWWWQGENARLASLATAALLGRAFYDAPTDSGVLGGLSQAASDHLSWITGCNPYGICFLYGFGRKNVPYMHSNYGHGSEAGGISNGITGLNDDGTGIVFRTQDQGNEWRWTEQWLPHAAWYLQALTAMVGEK